MSEEALICWECRSKEDNWYLDGAWEWVCACDDCPNRMEGKPDERPDRL